MIQAVCAKDILPHLLVSRILIILGFAFPVVGLGNARPEFFSFVRFEMSAQFCAYPLIVLLNIVSLELRLGSRFFPACKNSL
jgi:hypothetical protein